MRVQPSYIRAGPDAGISPSCRRQVRAFSSRALRLRLEARHLREQEAGLELREPEVGATALRRRRRLRGPARPRVVVEGIAAVGQLVVVGQDRAALARVEVLARLEAEAAGGPDRAQLAAPPLAQVAPGRRPRAPGSSGVAGDLQDRVQVAGVAAQVHGQKRGRPVRDRALDLPARRSGTSRCRSRRRPAGRTAGGPRSGWRRRCRAAG